MFCIDIVYSQVMNVAATFHGLFQVYCIRCCMHIHTFVFCGSVIQVSSLLSSLLENILMNGSTSSTHASFIPSMLMVEWSTEAVQPLFKQFVQDCATTIPTPVSVNNTNFKLCSCTFTNNVY